MPFTRLRYHVVWATKNREHWLDEQIESIVYDALYGKAKELGSRIMVMNGWYDHIHLVVAIPPRLAVSDFVREMKATSSRKLNIAHVLPHDFHWQDGYGAFTLNPYDMGGVLRYVRNQKLHHTHNDLWLPYERVTEDKSR